MDPQAILMLLLIPSTIVGARLLLAAMYGRRVRALMQEVRRHAATGPASSTPVAAGRGAPPRPDAAEIRSWVAATRSRRRNILLIYVAATLAYVVPGAMVLLLYVEPGKAPPKAVIFTSALLALPLLPALIVSLRRALSSAGNWTLATIFGIPIGMSLVVSVLSMQKYTTGSMALLEVVQTGLLTGVAFAAAMLYLRLRMLLHERLGTGPSPLRFLELALVGAIFVVLVAGAYGNTRAWGLLAPFTLLLAVLGVGLRLLARDAPRVARANILLLRVFGKGRKAEALLGRLADRLSTVSSLRWVSSSDVAAATVSPRGMLAYLTGRLRSRFVATVEDLDRVLGEGADQYVDGSFRTHEIACFENAWRPVVERLVREASVVLMDLRGFTSQNHGCVHELGLLVNLVPASHVMLLVDATTDDAELSRTLAEAWAGIRHDSPNHASDAQPFRRVPLNRLDGRSAASLADQALQAIGAS